MSKDAAIDRGKKKTLHLKLILPSVIYKVETREA